MDGRKILRAHDISLHQELALLANKLTAISRDETCEERPLGKNLTNQITSTSGRSSMKTQPPPTRVPAYGSHEAFVLILGIKYL